MDEKLSEMEISMILDTFMYLDYKESRDGVTLKDIVLELEHHPDYGGGGLHGGEYTVLKEAVRREQAGELVIRCQSGDMGYDTGTAACVFATPDESSIYVVYRGTGDGEWPDNGMGMTCAVTTQQKRALDYFEQVVETMEIGKEQRLIVTGHSKGGNKAQFITMETKYQELLDVCYSVDGQGFSEQAMERWKGKYGEIGYEKRREKLYGINGENDYVSPLGNSIIPKEHIRYVKTPVEKNNFAGYHDIKYMFASLAYDPGKDSYVTDFHGRKNSDAGQRGELGEYAALLSGEVMGLPPQKRDGCAAVIMHLMEAASGQKEGINGEKLTLLDLMDFTFQGIPLIAGSLLWEEEGRRVLSLMGSSGAQLKRQCPNIVLRVDYGRLSVQVQELEKIAVNVGIISEQIREAARQFPRYMKTDADFSNRLSCSSERVELLGKNLMKAMRQQENIVNHYQQWDGIDFFVKIR